MFHNLLIRVLWFCSVLFIIHCKFAVKKDESGRNVPKKSISPIEESLGPGLKEALRTNGGTVQDCWITLDSMKHFKEMEALDMLYNKVRFRYPELVREETEKFDNETIELMLATRARREGKGVIYEEIPAGLNLGGYCMIRMPQSVLFFHRMKLRNSTRFIINSLHTDFENMTMRAELNLQDLHLFGSYERAVEVGRLHILRYVPTYGMAEILLKNVRYSMEARLKFLHDSPYIVLIASTIKFERAMLMWRNSPNSSECDEALELLYEHIEEFMDRMKADLDSWLRDFFNHLLIFFKPSVTELSAQYREYQNKRTIILNEYVENATEFIKKRLHVVNATVIRLPDFDIYGLNGVVINMKNGWLRGLDSLYRRSIATGTHRGKIRTAEAVVGFSNLKVHYKYTTKLPNNIPPLTGQLILSADELVANMYITLIKNIATVDINFDSLKQLKEETLTVEGSANRWIPNFKHILEQHVISIMSNTYLYNIRLLRTLAQCVPRYIGYSYDEHYFDNTAERTFGDYIIKKVDSVELELDKATDKEKAGKYHLTLEEMLRVKKIA